MTWTYDITTDIGKVRRAIGDVYVTKQVFSDEEIQSFLDDQSNSINLAGAQAAEAWAALYAPTATSESIGGYTYNQKAVDNLLALAKRLREAEEAVLAGNAPAMTWAEMDLTNEDEEEET